MTSLGKVRAYNVSATLVDLYVVEPAAGRNWPV